MESLDWGRVTPEAVYPDRNEFIYVYNHDLTSTEKVDRTVRFILGRLNYYDNHLPKDSNHLIKIDARGQGLSDSTCDHIQQEIKRNYLRPKSLTIDIINK